MSARPVIAPQKSRTTFVVTLLLNLNRLHWNTTGKPIRLARRIILYPSIPPFPDLPVTSTPMKPDSRSSR